jgi:hypothetical protein
MIISHLPDSSRIWLFAASRPLEDDELQSLEKELDSFVGGWKSHGNELNAGFAILHKTIVAIAVDESAESPSGCSIDKAFRLLTDLGVAMQIDFMNRMLLVKPYCNISKVFTQAEAMAAIDAGELGRHDLVFNPSLSTLGELRADYLQLFAENWMGKNLIQTIK